MEIDLKDLMDKSEITRDDLDYIIYRLMKNHFCCYELTHAFISAYKDARTKIEKEEGQPVYFKSELQAARLISEWVYRFIDHEEDDSFP